MACCVQVVDFFRKRQWQRTGVADTQQETAEFNRRDDRPWRGTALSDLPPVPKAVSPFQPLATVLPQHFFHFLPLPQGQGSFRPTLGCTRRTGSCRPGAPSTKYQQPSSLRKRLRS